jgi:hypothetical protein
MSFFKHVGMANNKKVIIIQRSLGGDEAHMAAILYSDILPTRYHDDVMAVLESTEGQQAYEFKDILQRRMASNGENMLQALSSENYIKRVPQNAVIVKPNSKSSIRLDELVKILSEVGKGEQAVRKLDEMDAQLGLNSNPSQSNAQRNKDKIAAELNDGTDAVHYDGVTTAETPAPASDATQMMMMEMMKTMQAMQKEILDMKKTSKPAAAKKTTKTKNAV